MTKMRKKWQKMAKNEKKMAKNGKNFKNYALASTVLSIKTFPL